jgi:Domain of unknown function (DUF2760)
MDTPALLLGIGIGLGMAMLLMLGMMISRAGSFGGALWGLTLAGRANQDAALKAKIDAALGTTTPAAPTGPAASPKPSAEPLRLLAVLQAEARLLDFLMEDLSAASDAQIGAGVREVQKKAAAALKKHVTFEPVMGGTEGDRVTVAKGFDPSAVRLTGNVTGEAPYSGELQHGGWRVKKYTLPAVADGQDPMVIQPAEVQV